MENNIYFDRCIDFLVRMIEKYGDTIELPDTYNTKSIPTHEESRKVA